MLWNVHETIPRLYEVFHSFESITSTITSHCLPDSFLVCSLYFLYTGSGENSMIKNRAHAGVPPYVSDAILDRENIKLILILQINIEK